MLLGSCGYELRFEARKEVWLCQDAERACILFALCAVWYFCLRGIRGAICMYAILVGGC